MADFPTSEQERTILRDVETVERAGDIDAPIAVEIAVKDLCCHVKALLATIAELRQRIAQLENECGHLQADKAELRAERERLQGELFDAQERRQETVAVTDWLLTAHNRLKDAAKAAVSASGSDAEREAIRELGRLLVELEGGG